MTLSSTDADRSALVRADRREQALNVPSRRLGRSTIRWSVSTIPPPTGTSSVVASAGSAGLASSSLGRPRACVAGGSSAGVGVLGAGSWELVGRLDRTRRARRRLARSPPSPGQRPRPPPRRRRRPLEHDPSVDRELAAVARAVDRPVDARSTSAAPGGCRSRVNALNSPSVGWVTTTCSSAKIAPPPTGTSDGRRSPAAVDAADGSSASPALRRRPLPGAVGRRTLPCRRRSRPPGRCRRCRRRRRRRRRAAVRRSRRSRRPRAHGVC